LELEAERGGRGRWCGVEGLEDEVVEIEGEGGGEEQDARTAEHAVGTR
jgi:hypothetical protein